MEVNLCDAWELWLSGVSVGQHCLWSLKIFWWGRIGKVVQLIAATAIIIDIIGPDNLRSFGASINLKYPPERIKQVMADATDWIKVFYGYVRFTDREVSREQYCGHKFNQLNSGLVIGAALLYTGMSTYIAYHYMMPDRVWSLYDQLWRELALMTGLIIVIIVVFICGFILWMVFLLPLYPMIMLAPLVIRMIIGAVVDRIVIRPVAFILTIKWLEKWIKAGSLLLLLAGFHFDLLASRKGKQNNII